MRLLAVILLSVGIQVVQADDSPATAWAEYHACQYGEGQNAATMAQWTGVWNDWMDSMDRDDYTAVVLSPLYRSPATEIEMLWVGITDSNQSIAEVQSEWRNSAVKAPGLHLTAQSAC